MLVNFDLQAQRKEAEAAAKQFVPETEEPEAPEAEEAPASAEEAGREAADQVHRLEASGAEQGGLSIPTATGAFLGQLKIRHA